MTDAMRTRPPENRPRLSRRYGLLTVVAALPCLAAGVWLYGLRVLLMLGVALAAGAALEYALDGLRRERSPKGFWLTGPLLVLILGPATPLWSVAVGMTFATVIGKAVFGGANCYLFSPPLLGRCFLMLAYPALMTGSYLIPAGMQTGLFTLPAETLTTETPLVLVRAGEVVSMGKLILGGAAGEVGQSMALMALVGGVFLLVVRAISWQTVVGALGSFILLEAVLRPLCGSTAVPPGWHLLTGGFLFGVFFLATDPTISPTAPMAKLFYGMIIGSVAIVIRLLGSGLAGITMGVLVANMLVPVLNRVCGPVGAKGHVEQT